METDLIMVRPLLGNNNLESIAKRTLESLFVLIPIIYTGQPNNITRSSLLYDA